MTRQKNEGEGNRTADRNYRKRTKEFIASGRVGAAAKSAAKAMSTAERKQLEEAEAAGKARARR
jgi:hypothetical protein